MNAQDGSSSGVRAPQDPARWPILRNGERIMKKWAADVAPLLSGLSREVMGAAARVAHAAFGDEPFEIVAYSGYGNANRAHVYGRVLEKRW